MSKSPSDTTRDRFGAALASVAVGAVTAGVSMLVMLYMRFVPSTGAHVAAAIAGGIGAWTALGSAASQMWIHERKGTVTAALGYVLLATVGATSVAFAEVGWARRDSWSAADQEMSIFPAWWVRTLDALTYTMGGTLLLLTTLGALLMAFGLPLSIALLAKSRHGERALATTAGLYALLASFVLLRHDWLTGTIYPVHDVAQVVLAKRLAVLASAVGASLSFASIATGHRR